MTGIQPARPLFLANRTWLGVVDGHHEYVEDRGTGAAWLFDLAADPGETRDARAAPEVREALRRALRERFPD